MKKERAYPPFFNFFFQKDVEYATIKKKGGAPMEEYRIIRSDRRTLAITVSREGEVIIRAPRRLPLRDIEAFVRKNEAWIQKHREKAEKSKLPPLSAEEIEALKKRARALLPALTAEWADKMKVEYGTVKITSAKKRFGSCNSKGNICYSYRLLQFPMEAIEYTVVHELAHRFEMNHSKRFYAIVSRYLPDYKKSHALLLGKGKNE